MADMEASWQVHQPERGGSVISEYVITFEGANQAVKAELKLVQAGLNPSVMPVVPQIAAGCGIALRIKPCELERCREALASADIAPSAVYERRAADYGFEYILVPPPSLLPP